MHEGVADLRDGLSGEASVTPDEAKTFLTISGAATPQTIRAAFARACRETHPDTAAAERAGITIGVLQHARDVLLDELAVINRACKLCGGVGKVRSTMGWRQCGACAGTGERR